MGLKSERGTFSVAIVCAGLTAGAAMMTPFGEKVTAENAWRNYPRPQMVRGNWTCLNGLWDYAIVSVTNAPGRPAEWDGKILVPFAPEAPLSGIGKLHGRDVFLWYTRPIVCHPKRGERILLHFDAIDFRAQVFIGHREVTDVPHEGGSAPFTLDITDFVREGANELNVCTWDPTMSFIGATGKQTPSEPGGCFYTRSSGIWQSVWMETVPAAHIADYTVISDPATGVAKLTFSVGGPFSDAAIEVVVCADGKTVASGVGHPGETIALRIPDPKPWTPETPNLYAFKATYGKDAVSGYFALRTFEMKKDAKGILRFFLNGRPRYVVGVLDQGWWPDGLLTPPSAEALESDIRTMKSCGFDLLRKHLKVEPRVFYHLCDTIGMLVMQDMPSCNSDWRSPFKPATNDRYAMYRTELKAMIDHLQKSPCVVIWAPYNEGWAQHGEFLTHMTQDWIKRYDPTRLVSGPSGYQDFEGGSLFCEGSNKPLKSEHKPLGECEAGDIVDKHDYRGPGMFPVNPRRASFLGEFGGLGHPVDGHLWIQQRTGDFRKGNWGYGGIDDTKTKEGLESVFLELAGKLIPLARKGLAGSVYTQATDIETEINGILTYDRRVLKLDAAKMKAAHDRVRAAAEAAAE